MKVMRLSQHGRRRAAARLLPLLFALSAFSAYSEAVPQAEQISDDFAALSWTGGSGKGSSAAAMYAGAEALYCATGRERVKKLCAADAANDDLRGKVSSFSLPDAKKGESASGAVFYGEKRRELYFVLRSQSGEDCRVLQVSIGDAAARAGKAVVSECSAERFTVPQVPEVSPLPPENIWGGVKVRGAIPEPALHQGGGAAAKGAPSAALPLPGEAPSTLVMNVTGGGSSRIVTCLADVRHLARCGASGNYFSGADIELLPGEVLDVESVDGKVTAKVFITDGKARIPAWYSDLRLLEKGGKGPGISDFALSAMEPSVTFAGFSKDTLFLAEHEKGTESPVTAISVSPRNSKGLDEGRLRFFLRSASPYSFPGYCSALSRLLESAEDDRTVPDALYDSAVLRRAAYCRGGLLGHFCTRGRRADTLHHGTLRSAERYFSAMKGELLFRKSLELAEGGRAGSGSASFSPELDIYFREFMRLDELQRRRNASEADRALLEGGHWAGIPELDGDDRSCLDDLERQGADRK